jgi:hypothetical protein
VAVVALKVVPPQEGLQAADRAQDQEVVLGVVQALGLVVAQVVEQAQDPAVAAALVLVAGREVALVAGQDPAQEVAQRALVVCTQTKEQMDHGIARSR